jgi:hypothetical protein
MKTSGRAWGPSKVVRRFPAQVLTRSGSKGFSHPPIHSNGFKRLVSDQPLDASGPLAIQPYDTTKLKDGF